MSDKPHQAAIEVSGGWYLRDAKGALVPISVVKPVDLLIDEMVRTMIADPPYDETTGYGVDFGRADYVAMAAQLAAIAGDFIMSINDTPFIRETFAAFDIEEVMTTWTISASAKGDETKAKELIIRNRR